MVILQDFLLKSCILWVGRSMTSCTNAWFEKNGFTKNFASRKVSHGTKTYKNHETRTWGEPLKSLKVTGRTSALQPCLLQTHNHSITYRAYRVFFAYPQKCIENPNRMGWFNVRISGISVWPQIALVIPKCCSHTLCFGDLLIWTARIPQDYIFVDRIFSGGFFQNQIQQFKSEILGLNS